jgi:hypothetical protein
MSKLLISVTRRFVLAGLLLVAGAIDWTAHAKSDPLPSWNDGATKKSITDFVARVTTQGGADFVPVEQRIATFDNDGTLWCEQPMYVQLAFALDRVKAMAPLHPEWKDKQPFKAVLEGDMKALAESGERGLVEIIMVTHAGMTTAEFEKIVTDWLATARDQRFKRPYTELVYQPMLELLAYLRANGFKTFIVSGGGVEFMRRGRNGSTAFRPSRWSDRRSRPNSRCSPAHRRCFVCRRSISSTTRPASRSESTKRSAAVPLPHSETPMAILRCCSGRHWEPAARGSA